LVATDQSRAHPSSWDDDVRRTSGQAKGRERLVLVLWRLRQELELRNRRSALPVRRADAIGPRVSAADHDDMFAGCLDLCRNRVAGHDSVLLRQEFHREMNAVEVASRDRKIARRFRTTRHHDRVVLREEVLGGNIVADFDVRAEQDAFDQHLRHPAVDRRLLHLEIGNAIAEQPADAIRFFVDHDAVARTGQLLCAGESCRTGADHSDTRTTLRERRFRHYPPFVPTLVNDEMFDRLDSDRIIVDVERAGFLAGRGQTRPVSQEVVCQCKASSAACHCSR
jgi:hypothetical protein